jgi:hypothetical protein
MLKATSGCLAFALGSPAPTISVGPGTDWLLTEEEEEGPGMAMLAKVVVIENMQSLLNLKYLWSDYGLYDTINSTICCC